MKQMKKGTALLTAAALSAALLTGCGSTAADEAERAGENVKGYLEQNADPDRVSMEIRRGARDIMADGYYRAGGNGKVKGGMDDMGRDMGEKAKDILDDAGRGMKRVGKATGRAAHEIGKAAKRAGRDVMDEVKKP